MWAFILSIIINFLKGLSDLSPYLAESFNWRDTRQSVEMNRVWFNNFSLATFFFYQALVDRWWKEDRLLFNSYGPTETTVSATAILLNPGEPISIGVPLPNYVCCLLDETTGQPTSANTGELCIRGPGVALGYVGRESLTRTTSLGRRSSVGCRSRFRWTTRRLHRRQADRNAYARNTRTAATPLHGARSIDQVR